MRAALPSGSTPGTRVRPMTLTEKMTMRVISGARIRRITRKIVDDAWLDDSRCARAGTRCGGSCRPNSWVQKTSSGLLTVAPASPAVEGDGLGHQQHDRDQVGQQGAAGQGDDAGRGDHADAPRGDLLRPD